MTVPLIQPWDLLHKAIPNTRIESFKFGVPFYKGPTGSKGRRWHKGVASTPSNDLQNEEVVQNGLDVRYFVKHGYFNYDHKDGFDNKVGQPTAAIVKRVNDRDGNSVMGLWVEGFLWPKGHPRADEVWQLATSIEAADADRQLGYSIEGKVLKRDGTRILKAWVKDIACTPSPINTMTWMELSHEMSKSFAKPAEIYWVNDALSMGHLRKSAAADDDSIWMPDEQKALTVGGGSVLVPESLEGNLKPVNPFDTRPNEEDDVQKALHFAYSEMRSRGYAPSVARAMALAAVARQILL